MPIGRELWFGRQLVTPIVRPREQGKARLVAGRRIDEHRIDAVQVIPQAVRTAIDRIVAVRESRDAGRKERNHERVALASREVGQALELGSLDQSSAMRRVLGLRTDLSDFGVGKLRTTGGIWSCERGAAENRGKDAGGQHRGGRDGSISR